MEPLIRFLTAFCFLERKKMLDANLNLKKKSFAIIFAAVALVVTLFLSIAIASPAGISPYTSSISVMGTEDEASQQQSGQAQQQPAGVNLSEYEDAILYLINTTRVSNGLAALQPNQSLTDISRTRSNDMMARDYFSHYTPEGTTVFNIMRSCGIKWSAAGENLAQSLPADIGSPEAFMDAWMKSPGHAANILKTKYGIIGVGMIDNGDRRVVTTVFRN